jgi:hypothetical protein
MIPGLLRRRGPTNDADARRHTLYAGDPSTPNDLLDARVSEQLERKVSPSSLQPTEPDHANAMMETSAGVEQSPVLPPMEAEHPKYRRFSMLRFRHASDSQLSTRARQQANASPAPPVPARK